MLWVSQIMAMSIHKAHIVFLLCLSIFCIKLVVSEDQVTYFSEYCSEGVRHDQGNTYQTNLNLLLSNLTSAAATRKFYNSTIGEGRNKIEGIYLCNGAYTAQVCSKCITVAAGQIQQKCPNDVEAIIWYGQCMLRYSNRSIFSVEDDSVYRIFEYGPLDYKRFDQELMNGIQLKTIVQPSCRIAYFYVDLGAGVGKGFSNSWIVLTAVAAIAATSLISNVYMCFRKVKARGKPTGLDEMESMENLHLQYNTIKAAADNFSPSNKIGQGGFGVVYMGTLPDGQAIAVKRLASQSGQGMREFKSEACLVAKLQHKNLVKLFGFCLEGEEKLLVYEFLPNKSLDRYLFDANKGACLKWETRKKVVMGIARGLVYLHEDSRFRIIHRDLKPSNILLDADMNPKIADFGMAKLFGNDQTQGNTSRVAGTFGYMAPEYAATGHFSVKSDVFSFGVILLEVVSGRRNSVLLIEDDDENLLNYTWRLWNEGTITELVDPNIKEACSTTEVTRYIHIGLLSIQQDAARRPTMASILSMLSSESIALPPPKAPPAFPYQRNLSKDLDYSNAVYTAELSSVQPGLPVGILFRRKRKVDILMIVICIKLVVSEDQVTYYSEYCSEGVRHDQGNTYQTNLNLILSNLTLAAATKKFYNSSIGEGRNKIEGIFLCNGAYTAQVCSKCITVAAGQIQQKCPNDVEAIIWYGQCMLRYSNRSIFSIEDHSVYRIFENGPLNYKQFNQELVSTLIDLSNTVKVDDTQLASANGVVYIEALIGLVAYVECTPDITQPDCKKCLQTGLYRLEMNGIQLKAIVQPSCRIAYVYVDVGADVGKGFTFSWIVLTAVAAIAVASLISNVYMCFRKVKARGKPTGLDEMESMENLHLQYNTIKAAADNFSPANKIGQGGFGGVYMGTLPDGQVIAIKRLASQSVQGLREFKSEACLVAKLQHKNLVKLFGFCLEGEEKLLVYEFVPNKSLDRYLFDANRGACLKWETRKKVMMGIARGLVYLHEDSRFRIIHRDLKPSNILLDADMNPKIADFGMAKLFGNDQSQGNTSRVAGTFGYMAPEYAATGHFSVKSDIFSFGVILLEVVSGRRNSVLLIEDDDENLLNYTWRLWNQGSIAELVDPNIKELCSTTEVTRYIQIGLLSIQEDAARRPTMASILSMLSSESITLPSPKPPPAFPYRRNLSKDSDYSNAVFTAEVFTDVNVR
ncbi:hypothetical protein KSS87_011374 [Heliosperma pusillum]|nr:hypothetical protein KSS87_011374 [Heliosperma pusillum]